MVKMLTIREFLKLACIGTLAGVLAACGSKPINVQVVPTVTKTFTPTATNTPEPTTTNTPEATPTETQKFTKENITIIPMDMADIPKLVEVADPINNQVQFKADMAKIWSVVKSNILPNFKGDYFEPARKYPNHQGALAVSISAGSLMVRDEFNVVASCRYKVDGKYGVGLFVLMMDKGKVIPMVIMSDPTSENYVTSTGNSRRSLPDLLKMLKDGGGVFPLNYVYSTELFYKNSQYISEFGSKFLAKYGTGEAIENWSKNYSSTNLDDSTPVYTVFWQSPTK